ncbi:MAG: serine/threonine protein kinase [Verrucomicrobia bacterium]|nr:serine/threonine protein kinase [Verrucomicrobiota bacterium]
METRMDGRKHEIEVIFGAAIELAEPSQREIYLARACGGDDALRVDVEELIRAYEKAGGFLALDDACQEAVVGQSQGTSPAEIITIHEKPGDVIGRYKLLERIGEGGCGVVYVAEQAEPVRRRVALKVIKLGMDTRSVVARFEAERQALALMDHPNIAKVFDAGTSETGRPFFVMELVRGIRITDYCDRNKLPLEQRLILFTKVCHAIQHAHQKGIIHRDVKPSNILVTLHDGIPVPKVIDFGIAKATNQQRLTDKTLYTAFEQFVGTPAYTSPEQAELSGLDIDTRSDIYALGVLLYELLTGTTPFSAKTLQAAGLDEMRRIIREEDPVRPSTRLSSMLEGELITTATHRRSEPPKLIHWLRGDLDWIIMKCLEKDRSRRYETAHDLAQDLTRHLNQEPVMARPPSAVYRMRKFVRRNKVIVTAGATAAAVLTLGIVASTWQAVRAVRASIQAEKARAQEATQRRLAEEATRTAEEQRYSASIGEAQALIEQGQYGRAKQVLAQPALAPRRGWEWGWLQRACNLDLMTLSGKGAAFTGVAFSPDGQWLAAGSNNRTIQLWDLATGSERSQLKGHTDIVVLIGFSPDSRRLVTASFDATAKVWEVPSGALLFTLKGHAKTVYCAVYSPDGKTIATASADRTVRLWNAADGAPLEVIEDYGDSVLCVAFSPDGRQLAYAGGSGDTIHPSADTTIRILDLETRRSRSLSGHSHTVAGIAFSHDGSQIATASWDLTAGVAHTRTGSEVKTLFKGTGFGGYLSVALSPVEPLCALGGGVMGLTKADAGVHVIDLATGTESHVFEGHAMPIRGLAFNPDGTRIASASFDGTVRVWPARPLPEFLSLEGHDQAVWTVEVSPDGHHVATGSLDQTAKVWELETGRLVTSVPVMFPVLSLAFSPDGKRLITPGSKATAQVWPLDLEDSTSYPAQNRPIPILTLGGHAQMVTAVAYGPGGRHLATGSKDRTARIWASDSGQLLLTLVGHGGWILSVAFSPDEKQVATASRDHSARIWETQTGRLLFVLEGHTGPVLDISWSPDASLIATASQDATARLWDARTGAALLPPLRGHRDGVSSVAFSPDGRRLATAAGGMDISKSYQLDNSVFLWDVDTHQSVLRLRPHFNVVRSAAFSPDGTRLVTGSVDNTARVRSAFAWDRAQVAEVDRGLSETEWLERYKRRYWSQLLALANPASISAKDGPGSDRHMQRHLLGEFNVASGSQFKSGPSVPLPARDRRAGANQIDLSQFYNSALNEIWLPTTSLDDAGQNLAAFPVGLGTFGGVLFDTRGLIQLGWGGSAGCPFPTQVTIPIGRPLQHFHVLHGVARGGDGGRIVGEYRLHYADGKEVAFEIRCGQELVAWWDDRSPESLSPFSQVAWTGPRSETASAEEQVRLFRTTYTNPSPERLVTYVDYVSQMTRSAPFLLAITVE